MKFAIFLIKVYRLLLSPFVGNCCRFYPSCSAYAIEAIEKRGLWRGGWLTLKRLLKCGPWHRGGYDPINEYEAQEVCCQLAEKHTSYHFKTYKEGKGFWAECVEFPGCCTQGNSKKELLENMEDALNTYLVEPEETCALIQEKES